MPRFEIYDYFPGHIAMVSGDGKHILDLKTALAMQKNLAQVLDVFKAQIDIGHRIKEAREAAGLSVGQVAILVKISTTEIEAIEEGSKTFCDQMIYAFAELYNVDPDWLVGRKTEDDVSPEWKEKLSVLPESDRQKMLRLLAMKGGGE